MMRYDIEETAVYIQVRTVVWEDGAARPLLPDRWASARQFRARHTTVCATKVRCRLKPDRG
jgi:hypothetical protein